MKKIVNALKKIFGITIILELFAGGIAVLGYVAALCIGGETATDICLFIFEDYFPWVIRLTSVSVLLGLVTMYLSGQKSLTMKNEQ